MEICLYVLVFRESVFRLKFMDVFEIIRECYDVVYRCCVFCKYIYWYFFNIVKGFDLKKFKD